MIKYHLLAYFMRTRIGLELQDSWMHWSVKILTQLLRDCTEECL